MNHNIEVLKKKLNSIIIKDYCCIERKGFGEVGLYLEKLLGISANTFSVADFNGIELKVSNIYSNYPITLFSLSFDGPDLFELTRLVNRFGMTIPEYDSKILYVKLSTQFFSLWGRYLKFKLINDTEREKIFCMVSNVNGKIIEKRAFWTYKSIYEVIYRKINILCIVYSKSKIVKESKYVKFCDYDFYKLKSEHEFINAICSGKITINIKCGVYKSGKLLGKSYYHGVSFQILKDDLSAIFEPIFLSN